MKFRLSRFKDVNKTNILFLSKKNCTRNYSMIFVSKDIKDIALCEMDARCPSLWLGLYIKLGSLLN